MKKIKMSKIIIKKSKNADTRSATKKVSKEELLYNSRHHIEDVSGALDWLAANLLVAGDNHDYTKIENIDEFHADFELIQQGMVNDFKQMNWFQNIHLKERHHLTDRVPDDVNLFDVLERIADIVTAGMARTGTIYDDTLDADILVKAYKNTIELLKDNIEVVE